MGTIAEQIASYTTSIKYEDIPPEVIHKVKAHLLDTFGCAIGAYTSEPSRIARRMANRIHDCDMPASVFGSGQKSTVELATFANGIMLRYLDFSDVGGGHPSDHFAPIMTCADAVHAGGKEIILATVLSYEIFGRLMDIAKTRDKGFDDQPVHGAASCAMAAGRILGLTQDQMVQAINLSVAPNLSLRQIRAGELSNWKGCAMANTSRNAVFAALLAKEGMTGPSPIYEGRFGLFMAVTGQFQLPKFGGNGGSFRIMETNIKISPACNSTQNCIEGALRIRPRLPAGDEIIEINLGMPQARREVVGEDIEKWHPKTRETADHSVPFVVVLALLYGAVEVKHYDDGLWRDPNILSLMQKVKTYLVDGQASIVEVKTKSGKKFTESVEYRHGNHRDPLSDQEIEQKFTTLTKNMLPEQQRNELMSTVWDLENLDDASKLMQLLVI
jgi:2-methylcitrate dehydratase